MITKKLTLSLAFCIGLQLTAVGCGGGGGGSDTSAPLPSARELPALEDVVALSEHYVMVVFAERVGDMAMDASLYTIKTANGAPLVVHEARPDEEDNQVILVTDAQEAVQYELAAEGPDGGGGQGVFEGNTTVEPDLLYAIALSNTTVLLTFNEILSATTAQNVSFYRISNPDLVILSSALQASGDSVILTTRPQENIEYSVKVTNVRRSSGGNLLDPTNSTASFFGIPPTDTVAPQLLSATSTGKTTVVLRFSEPLNAPDVPGAARADDPINFSITPALAIVDAEINAFDTQIILTTVPQEAGLDYTVTASSIRDKAGNVINGAANTATFRFLGAPALQTAVALTNTSVLLTFSERLDQASAETVGFYAISAPDLAITAAVLQANQISVLLTTASQANTDYTVTVTNVRGRLGGPVIDPERNTASFSGIPAVDTVAPQLLSAQATNSTTVLLTFNEPLRSLSNPLDNPAEDASNYSLAPAVSVVGAQLNESQTQVLLTTLPLAEGIPYVLTVADVTDLAGNLIDPANQTTTFTFLGQAGLGDDDLPRVVAAASTGNRSIIIQFSRPMGSSALNPGSYVVVQTNINSEVGFLTVVGAAFTGPDRTAVQLTTLSQNELTYTVTAATVRDFIGLPMAPKQIVAGVLLDPASASFPGTPPSCAPLLCTNGAPGIDGAGLCASDDDCTATPPCTVGSCVDACTTTCTLADTDGDTLTDNDEQRGWVVTIKLANGGTIVRQVTADLTLVDTDGDELDDALEKNLGTDPRQVDTDGDQLNDFEEFNIIYSDQNSQDSDADGISDTLEVEFFKTNAIVADSDGDGFADARELFEANRDARIADLPEHQITVGGVKLLLDERFTFVDEDGNTQTETSSTETTLQNETSSGSSNFNQTVGHIFAQIEGGIDTCQDACQTSDLSIFLNRLKIIGTIGGGAEFTTSNTTESARAAMNAFQSSLEKGRELSTSSAVTREIVGARLEAEVTLENLSDVAFRLSNVEIRVATTDPQDPTLLVPVATLLPDSTLQTGNVADFNIGPGQQRGPVIFSNSDVFPSLIQDLMRAPRGLVFTVANFDQATEDGRNFAYGLQQVRERSAEVSINFGDGEAKRFHAITAGVLNRPRSELRCAPTGDHPDYACRDDDDCGTSTPCEGGTIVGGFSNFPGTGEPEGTRLDFVLRDILQMRRSVPAAILAGPNLTSNTSAQGDDVQVVPVGTTMMGFTPETVVVAPGRNLVLETAPSGDDFNSAAPRIVAGEDGTADTAASGDDVQVMAVGTFPLAAESVVIAPGPNGRLDSVPSEDDDDVVLGPDGILPGNDGAVQSVAQGDDVQLVPVATTGVPEDTVVITAGRNGVLDTPTRGDDVATVVTGYEVSKTCDANTPFAILAGRNVTADTLAETGICTVASPPHFVGESCSRTVANPDAGCGVSANAPTSTVAVAAAAGATSLTLTDATAFPSSGIIGVGSQETRYTSKAGNVLTILPLASGATAGQVVTLVTGRCTADTQVVAFGQNAGSPNAIVVSPSTALFLASVPGGDDVYVAPGIPCTQNADCTAGGNAGQCTGPQNVVRVDNRRNGQFRRFWALLLEDDTQFQTDFGDILVRPGDTVSLAFIQDVDRDGLIAEAEFLVGSSDFKKDSDDEGIGDFSEVRIGWEVGVVGQLVRRVFPDPRLRDSDGDGLTDLEEQDLRAVQCACDAMGPKSLLGSGRLLREPNLMAGFLETGAQPCRADSDCVSGFCRDATHCPAGGPCPSCSLDVTLNRTDPRVRDTDEDDVTDSDEVSGYLTGAGIVDTAGMNVILAGSDLRADTTACPRNYCVEDANKRVCATGGAPCTTDSACGVNGPCIPPASGHCMTDADCFSHNCIHPVQCDEVQVVPVGNGVRDARTVIVVPGPISGLQTAPFMDDPNGRCTTGGALCDSNLDCGANSPCILGNGIAESRLLGDDQLVVGPGQSVISALQCVDGGNFELCSAIKPGPNGQLDSLRIGDDVTIPGGAGQKLEVSDPLNPDTDLDLIIDGNERLLGSSPNLPGDAIFGGDLDADGLTDVLEGLGWTVQVTNAAGMISSRMVSSDPNLPDTDLDGVPDFAEANLCTPPQSCPTDPEAVDTDGDGITDYDELSAEQFTNLARFNDFFPGFLIDGTASQKYGTDPTKVDSDDDGLADRFELLVGWIVVRDDGSVEPVFSDPTTADTDGDGLPDDQEEFRLTDPGDPDTDGDGRLDGLEVNIGTQPLQPDIFVSVTYSLMQLAGAQDGSEGLNEWRWKLSVQESSQLFPGTTLSTERTDCPVDSGWPCGAPNSCLTPLGVNGAGCDTNRFSFFINRSTAIALTPNNGIVLNGLIVEVNGFRFEDTLPIEVVPLDRCRMSFVDQPLTFDALQGGQFMTRTFQLAGEDGQNPETCKGLVVAEISVNCVGQAKGFCHAGNPCVTPADCQSNVCHPNPPSNVGTCGVACGDGFPEAGEACDDNNTTNGDGCDSACQIEAGNVCSGIPSLCGTPTPTVPTITPTPTPTPTVPTSTPTITPTASPVMP